MNEEIKLMNSEELEFLKESLFTDEFPNLLDELLESKYSINDLKITPRDATYWDKQGILPIIKGLGMRRKYDIVQSIWIKLIQQMRSLGISLNKIKKLKENLLEPKIDLSMINPTTLHNLIDEVKKKYDDSMTLEQLLARLEENKPSLFKSIVLATIIFRKSIHCIVNKDGVYIIYDSHRHQELLSKEKEFAEFVSEPYFCISFSEAYRSLINEWAPKPFLKEISLLSETELKILELIKRRDINSITVRYKEGEPYLLEVDEKNEIFMEQRFLDVIAKNGFQKISVTTRNGKIVHFENKVLQKLSKSTK
ncbi:MAG: MerR family transcriptional regulator [Bacteroidota bacterium]